MAIHSSVLGSVRVSGKEAKAFRLAMQTPKAMPAAIAAAKRGRKLASTLARQGSVIVKLRSKPKAVRNQP